MKTLFLISSLVLSQQNYSQTNLSVSQQVSLSEATSHSIYSNEELSVFENQTLETGEQESSSYFYMATYDFNGNFISSNGINYLYYGSNNASSYCTFVAININSLIQNESFSHSNSSDNSCSHSYLIDLKGAYVHSTNRSYQIIDYPTSTLVETIQSTGDYLTIEYNPLDTNLTLYGNYLSFVIFNYSISSCYEVIYSSQAKCRSVFSDHSYHDSVLNYGNSSLRKMDLFIPDDRGPLPIIVTIHGGFWWGGDKNYFDYLEGRNTDHYQNPLSDNGFIHANINYNYNTSSCTITCEQMLQDIDEALSEICDFCGTRADSDRICLWGYSAGAHLAMLYALNTQEQFSSINHSPKMVISEAGPYNFREGTQGNWLNTIIPGTSYTYNQLLRPLVNSSITITYSDLIPISPIDTHSRIPDFSILSYSEYDTLVSNESLGTFISSVGLNTTNCAILSGSSITGVPNELIVDNISYVSSHEEYCEIQYESSYLTYLSSKL